MNFLVDFYGIREPVKSELEFFKKRPEVGGYAAEDNKIVLNPFSTLKPSEQASVAQNEAMRLFMRSNKYAPHFELTKEQKSFFKGTEYGKDQEAAKQSVIARILTGDPSVGEITPEQKQAATDFMQQLQSFQQQLLGQ